MQSDVTRPVPSTSAVKTHQHSNSPSAQRISQALKAQRCPTNKEICSFCKQSTYCINIMVLTSSAIVELSIFNVLAYPVERWKWVDLVNEPSQPSLSTHRESMKTFYLEKNPLSTTLQLDLSPLRTKKGDFKIAAFGTSTTSLFKSSVTQNICAKRTYHVVERVTVSDLVTNGSHMYRHSP